MLTRRVQVKAGNARRCIYGGARRDSRTMSLELVLQIYRLVPSSHYHGRGLSDFLEKDNFHSTSVEIKTEKLTVRLSVSISLCMEKDTIAA